MMMMMMMMMMMLMMMMLMMTIKITAAAAAITKQQQPKQYAGLTGTGKIMKSAQIHKYTNTHIAMHTYKNNKNNNHLSSLKYLHPKDVTPHTRFSVIHYYLYEKLFIKC
jgi:vancomycin permeability regulator SanA